MTSKSTSKIVKSLVVGLALVVSTAAVPAAFAQDAPATIQGRTGPGLGENGKFRVVLVNSFLGNDWRVQMQNSAEIASKKEPYASEWEFSVLNTDNTAEAQNAGLENLLAQGVDAILLDSQSDTNAAEIVKRACAENIVVVSFDVTQQVDAPCHVRIEPNFFDASKVTGRWVANALGCKGNVIMDRGLQGVSIADDIYNGNLKGLKEVCGDSIKVVGDYYGEFSATKQEGLISALLASNRDVQAVLGQADCVTIASAFEDAELPMPVLRCAGSNANLLLCAKEGMQCIASSNTPAVSIGAMELAYDLLKGESMPAIAPYPIDHFATDISKDVGAPVTKIEVGVNALPDQPPGFQPAFNWRDAHVQLTLEEVTGAK